MKTPSRLKESATRSAPPPTAPVAAAQPRSRLRCPSIWQPRWFLSKTVRQATQMCKHVRKLTNAQRDLLSPQALDALAQALANMLQAVQTGVAQPALTAEMEKLEQVANKWLKPYPNAGLRENVEVILVALAVAMGIRTFFLQPFKIPTGSMQPTLYGITHENLIDQPAVKIPNAVSRFFQYWFRGVKYVHLVARADGELRSADSDPSRFLLFNLKQRIQIGNETYTIWFPPENLLQRANLTAQPGYFRPITFKKGQDIIKLKVISGDHLFVDRLSYNFRHPHRGDIVVFQTSGIHHPQVPTNQYYIKRLIGLPGETVSISTNNRVVINGRELTASQPGFENLYGYWSDDRYLGHVHAGPYFPDQDHRLAIGPQSYLVMGDNTRNSLDSRYWGDFPQETVIGKSYFVYWPISERFGWSHR